MKNIVVNKNSIREVRPQLQLPLFALIQHMNVLGWDATVTMPGEHDGSVFFSKRNEWNGRPLLASRCAYGYRFESAAWSLVDAAAQRAAELCLTVYEQFGLIIPTTADINGDIRPCLIINQPQYSSITYLEYLEKHRDKQLTIRNAPAWAPDGWCFSYYGFNVTVTPDEEQRLLDNIRSANRVLSGEFAEVN